MNATVACVADATRTPTVPAVTVRSFPDPLDPDCPTDEVVVTTRRGMVRLALVATEVASRFQRDGVAHDPMAWMLSPRTLFGGDTAIDACSDREACIRATLLHGLAIGLDADPMDIDALMGEDDGGVGSPPAALRDQARCQGIPRPQKRRRRSADGPSHDNVRPLRPTEGPAPRLFTATIVHDDGFEMVHAFHASFAMDEAEVAGRLYLRMGEAAADAAIVSGFDHTSPIVEALVSQAICDMLLMIDAEPMSPLAAGLDLNIEQRFAA